MAVNVSDPTETPEAIRAAYKVIVAVDIGTTYTKVAWRQTKHAEAKIHLFVNGQWEDQRQVPTALLYKPSQHRHSPWEFYSFGHDAMQKHTEEKQSWALFKTFKMELHDRKDFCKNAQVKGSTSTKGGKPSTVTLPAVRMFCDILLHIKDLILDHIRRSHGHDYAKEDIKWVLTVPAMWRASARDVMRQAAKEADIYKIHAPRQLAIALEPESAALHIRSLQARDLLMGKAVDAKRYIVIDIGGGTIDVAVHSVECHEDSGKEYVHELEGCIGSACGATVIDREFETFLCDLDVPGYPKVFSKMRPNQQVWNKLMANFETSKVKYEGSDEMKIEMPGVMLLQYRKEVQKILKSLVKRKNPQVYFNEESTLLRVSPDICLKWYEPTISSTVELIRKLHAKHHVEALFVVGGFAKCKILSQRLELEFSTLQLVIPEDPAFAIIQGAVRYGPVKAIESRTSHATYGIKCVRPFRDDDDPKKKTWSKTYKTHFCDDIFNVMVTREQKLNPGAPYTTIVSPLELDQTTMAIAIYATDAKYPKYVTDPGCVMIGTFSIKINSLPPGAAAEDDDRQATIKMDFSGPEIFVTAVDNTGNYHSEQTVDFLPTCQYHDQ